MRLGVHFVAECRWILFADEAALTDGRIALKGLYDRLLSAWVPSKRDLLWIVAKFIGEPGEEVDVSVSLIAPGGQASFGPALFRVKFNSAGAEIRLWDFRDFILPEYGFYTLSIEVCGRYFSEVLPVLPLSP